jgi:hypothetical protein
MAEARTSIVRVHGPRSSRSPCQADGLSKKPHSFRAQENPHVRIAKEAPRLLAEFGCEIRVGSGHAVLRW